MVRKVKTNRINICEECNLVSKENDKILAKIDRYTNIDFRINVNK